MQQITQLAAENAGVFGAVALALGVIAFLVALVAIVRVQSVLRPLSSVRKHAGDSETVVSAIIKAIENNDLRIEALTRNLAELTEKYRSAIQYMGLVRYDAFEDIAGQQSYSLCLLDGDKNGVLFSYITGRNSARSYAVAIEGGVPARKLGDEEAHAMDQALSKTAKSTAG
ncbi:MAG: DUF4446 family protein [bacterium]